MPLRHDGRTADQLRPFKLQRGFATAAPGSVVVEAGSTVVLCTASLSTDIPPWLVGKGKGWVTAEYNMLPGSTTPRKPRDRTKVDGRTTEIQRLIGRSLRSIVDLELLGERLVTVDCDVLRADGGTRTASITGAYVALVEALRTCEDLSPTTRWPLTDSIAAVSAGVVGDQVVLDLDYVEDSAARVDMNVVMTGSGSFVEVQGTGESSTFTMEELQQMLELAGGGIAELTAHQAAALA